MFRVRQKHLDYVSAAWSPCKQLHSEVWKVQMRATKLTGKSTLLIVNITMLVNEDILEKLDLPTFKYCRLETWYNPDL